MNVPFVLPRPATAHRDAAMVFASGFLATVVMTTSMFVLPLIGAGEEALPVWLVRVFGSVDFPVWTARLITSNTSGATTIAVLLHVALGFGYAWLYAEHVEPRLTASPVVAGAGFGVALWLVAQVVAVPLLGMLAPTGGELGLAPGPLSIGLGPGAAVASLVAHVAYGGTLGFVYGCHFGGRCRT